MASPEVEKIIAALLREKADYEFVGKTDRAAQVEAQIALWRKGTARTAPPTVRRTRLQVMGNG